jgi:hypothetical protein
MEEEVEDKVENLEKHPVLREFENVFEQIP